MAWIGRPLKDLTGKFWGTAYTAEAAGDIFPVHVHEPEANHITIVAYGEIELLGHEEGKRIAAKPGGAIKDFVPGQPHGFKALTAGSTILNLLHARP